jgi:DNA invertase Pin-like site-specific DNA recombinase
MSREHRLNPARSEKEQEDVKAWNLAIVESLADGIHPMTGDDLDEASIFNDEKVRRALNAAREAMQKEGKRETRRASLPKKAGNPWSEEEDAVLVERFEGGMGFAELGREHGRTDGAIRSRLTKLGKLIPEH